MRKPFQKETNEYEQARADYGRSLPPDILDDILERSLKQYPNSPLPLDLLIDMKVMKHLNDKVEKMVSDANKR